MAQKLLATAPGFSEAFSTFVQKSREEKLSVDGVVADIIADVKARGDAAVVEYSKRFDGDYLSVQDLAFSSAEIADAAEKCDPKTLKALQMAAQRIRAYHQLQKPRDEQYVDVKGVRLGWRWTALSSAGLYVPGGTAPLFSSVLMNAIPAKIAGVERLVVTMPTPKGVVNPLMLAACSIAGVDEIYRIGGAQAIAALAYGTETVAPVDKIFGPGNAYVSSAKKQVFGVVGIDMVAGPSEVTVVADGANDPEWIAADLLAQAEHDTSSQSILITDDAAFADRVMKAVEGQLKTLPRVEIAAKSWKNNGAIVIVDQLADAAELINKIAPEHLELAIEDPDVLAKEVRHAGAIFLGRFSPEAIGDYIAGPSHVLPTSGAARFSSGLSTSDFLKRTSLIGCDSKSLIEIGPSVVAMAQAESLEAHARSIALRLRSRKR